MFLSAETALQDFIARLASLSPLSRADTVALGSLNGRMTRVRASSEIAFPGMPFEHAVLVASGLIGRYLPLSDGKRQITAVHVAGELADLHRIATPKAGSALQALTNAAIVLVSGSELKSLALASPRIAHAFWAYSAVDAAVLARWAANLGRRDAKVRLAYLLCELALRMEASGQGIRTEFLLELTQGHLADMLGLTPVHVSRTLKTLKEIGAIEVEGHIFRIPDWPRLAAIADFDREYLQVVPLPDEAA